MLLPKKISANDSPMMASMPPALRGLRGVLAGRTLSAAYMKYERS